MPRLNEYVSVGFCSGYGDGDYRVSLEVQSLSRARVNELLLAMFHAQRCVWENWCAGQHEDQPADAEKDAPPAPYDQEPGQ